MTDHPGPRGGPALHTEPSPAHRDGNDAGGGAARPGLTPMDLLTALQQQVDQLAAKLEQLHPPPPPATSPPPWVWFNPPQLGPVIPPDDGGPPRADPRATVKNFVTWYNDVFVGRDAHHDRIPDCWRAHPGLAMEIAALAYSWRAANLTKSATPEHALRWLGERRPGFVERMHHTWLAPHCATGTHRPAGAAPRPDRYSDPHLYDPLLHDNHNTDPPPHSAPGG
jgi:hypothetical protein